MIWLEYSKYTINLVTVVCHFLTHNLGGFPTIHHNEMRDFTASLLSEVCHNVAIEPHLQSLNGEGFRHIKSANTA